MEILKLIIALLGGGLAGAFLNEWFRRRNSRLQSIPLIERVNRLVDPVLEGFTLARVSRGPAAQLERVENLREYQFTLRNTSPVHMKDVEIQFEFPAEDIEARAERPVLSRTAPILVAPVVTAPWKHGFRWRIPSLPSTDSMEFTFKAVNPPSEAYEVALFNADRVVINKSKGEPATNPNRPPITLVLFAFGLAAVVVIALIALSPYAAHGNSSAEINAGGCQLRTLSLFEEYDERLRTGPWLITVRFFNVGAEKCTVQAEQLDPQGAFTIDPGTKVEKERLAIRRPKLMDTEVDVHAANMDAKKVIVSIYREP
jgi:hypothetical protein